jgi:hypothetical protein
MVGFLSAIAGGAIQAWSTRRFEIQRFERQNRHDAYLSYLNGISRLSFAKDDNDEILSALAIIAEARGRVALCGSENVIRNMIKVFRHGDELYSPEARADISALILAMRTDSQGGTEFVDSGELFSMLYGNGAGRM